MEKFAPCGRLGGSGNSVVIASRRRQAPDRETRGRKSASHRRQGGKPSVRNSSLWSRQPPCRYQLRQHDGAQPRELLPGIIKKEPLTEKLGAASGFPSEVSHKLGACVATSLQAEVPAARRSSNRAVAAPGTEEQRVRGSTANVQTAQRRPGMMWG